MKRGGFTAHLAAMQGARTALPAVAAPVPELRPDTRAEPGAEHATAPGYQRVLDSSSDVLLRHRDRIIAGVPGCNCGKSYPENSHSYSAVLHAQHVADVIVAHVIRVAAEYIGDDLEAVLNPPAWEVGECGMLAAEAVGHEHIRMKEASTV